MKQESISFFLIGQIVLQCCVGFCCTTTLISHLYIYIYVCMYVCIYTPFLLGLPQALVTILSVHATYIFNLMLQLPCTVFISFYLLHFISILATCLWISNNNFGIKDLNKRLQ